MRRAIADASLTAAGALAVILAIVMIDERVREQIRVVLDARHPEALLSDMVQQAAQVLAIIAVAAKQQSLEHAPLVIFAVAALILVLCMLRT